MDLTCQFQLIVLLIVCICCRTASSESADPLGNYCNNSKNISSSSVSANVVKLLAQLVETTARVGFSAASYGRGSNNNRTEVVYGLAQCRGDVSSKDCSDCVEDAAKQIRTLCPNQADARIWYDYCFLRYDTIRDFRGQVDTLGILYANVESVKDPEYFKKKLSDLIHKTNADAINIPSNKGLGKGSSNISTFVTLYALVQCTRDLPQLSCTQCLSTAITNFDGFCDNKKGCRVLYSSCYVRYEEYPFYFPLDQQQQKQNFKLLSDSNVSVVVSKP